MRQGPAIRGAALACALVVAAPAAAQQPAAEAVATDVKARAEERALNGNVARMMHIQGRSSDVRPLVEIAPHDAALAAISRNIGIRRGQLLPALAEQALREAEALFHPVFSLAFTGSFTDHDKRDVRTQRFKTGTTFVANGAVDWTGIACNRPLGCHRVYNATNSPVLFQEFDAARAAGFGPTTVEAHPATLPDERLTVSGTLSQLLPWGAQLNLGVDLAHVDYMFVNNPEDPDRRTVGDYEKPWVRDYRVSAATPLPFTRNFGIGSEANLVTQLSEQDVEAAKWTVRAIVNEALLAVDGTYWDLVGAVQRLQAATDAVAKAGDLLRRTQGIFDRQLITAGQLAEVQAKVARLEAEQEGAYAAVVTASNRLRQLTDAPEDGLLVPVGYRAAMARALPAVPGIEQVVDNPRYLSALVDVRQAELVRAARERQTNPDVNLIIAASGLQSRSAFGYDTATNALTDRPDFVVAQATLLYTQPIFDRAVGAGLEIAELGVESQQLSLDQVRLGLRSDYVTAQAELQSVDRRLAITGRNRQLAEEVYAQALRMLEIGRAAEFEVTRQVLALLQARQDEVQAQVARKKAEARLMATLGLLPSRYAEQTSQTQWDRGRLEKLAASGHLQHFGEMR